MNVVFRVDASKRMGTGHVRRCLSLAQSLRLHGAKVSFLTRDLGLDSWVRHEITMQEHGFVTLPAVKGDGNWRENYPVPHAQWAKASWKIDAQQTIAAAVNLSPDWVVVDHYSFDARWHSVIADKLKCKIAVIEDLADRPLLCQLLVDHNWDHNHNAKYGNLMPDNCTMLGGPSYALLDSSYFNPVRYLFSDKVRSVGIFMGGSDPDNTTQIVLEAIISAGFDGPVEIVSTSANPNLKALKVAAAKRRQTTLSLDLPNLADFFRKHDIQIGAGGGATWERFCVGAPVLAICCAQNQRDVLVALADEGFYWGVGTLDRDAVVQAFNEMLASPELRRQRANRAMELVDGKGTARVVSQMFKLMEGR